MEQHGSTHPIGLFHLPQNRFPVVDPRLRQQLPELIPSLFHRVHRTGGHRQGLQMGHLLQRYSLHLQVDKVRSALGVVQRPLQQLADHLLQPLLPDNLFCS